MMSGADLLPDAPVHDALLIPTRADTSFAVVFTGTHNWFTSFAEFAELREVSTGCGLMCNSCAASRGLLLLYMCVNGGRSILKLNSLV